MGLKARLKRIEKAAEVETFSGLQEDGTSKRFREDAVMDAFVNMHKCGKAHYHGEELPPPHPLTVALRTVDEEAMPRLVREQGQVVALIRGEDAIYEGRMERYRPPGDCPEEPSDAAL